MCYGLPKIASICGDVKLDGQLGLKLGAAVAKPSLDTLIFNAAPRGVIALGISIEGSVTVISGKAHGSIVLVDARVPASVPVKFRDSVAKDCKNAASVKFA